MQNRRVLIVGTGIAGPTLAVWLDRFGFEPTLVERAPALRRGGYLIDFWGAGFDVAERMGLIADLRRHAVTIDEVRFVDDDGRRRGGFGGDVMRAALGDRYFSILRSDLSQVIYDALGGGVRTLFDDTVTDLHQAADGVLVEFLHAPAEQFDLVIGAGGLHSRVRRLVFGPETLFEKYLGYYVASFSADDYPHRDPHAYVGHAEPGRQLTRYSLGDGRTVFLLVFSAPDKLDVGHLDVRTQKDLLHARFRGAGWESGEMLARLDASEDIYFDAVSQIQMPAWSQKRTALVGDSCGCPSLLAGQGAALAMTGAYVLAGELAAARGDFATAFARYERFMQPFVARKQQSAQKFAGSFVPQTAFGIFVRNQITRLMRLPFVANLAFRGMLEDSIELPSYAVH